MKPVRKAVFPVAGLGTRILPATKAIPKEMLTIVDKPLIQYAVEEAREAGIEQMIFVTGRGKGALEDHFDIAYELEATMTARGKSLDPLAGTRFPPGAIVSVRQQEPLGLGHAVWCAREIVGDEPFAVLLPDDLMVGQPGCLAQMVEAYDKVGGNIVCAQEVPPERTASYGIITPGARDGRLTEVKGLVEKPSPEEAPSKLGVVGRYILQPEIMPILGRLGQGRGRRDPADRRHGRLDRQQPFHGAHLRRRAARLRRRQGLRDRQSRARPRPRRSRPRDARLPRRAGRRLMEGALVAGDGPVRRLSAEEAAPIGGRASSGSISKASTSRISPSSRRRRTFRTSPPTRWSRPRPGRAATGSTMARSSTCAASAIATRRLRPPRLDPLLGDGQQGRLAVPPPDDRDRRGGPQDGSGQDPRPGDLVAAFAWAISTQLDPEVAGLGDTLDDVETGLEPNQLYRLRRQITAVRSDAIGFRRFVAPDRDALRTLAALDFDWLAEDDRLHIVEAADRFARMAEELEAVRERAALLHEQITDLRAEQTDQRALYISIVAFIFLPLTFITGLLGMNVEGIPYAHSHWAFWGVVIFCTLVGVSVLLWFNWRNWLRR